MTTTALNHKVIGINHLLKKQVDIAIFCGNLDEFFKNKK